MLVILSNTHLCSVVILRNSYSDNMLKNTRFILSLQLQLECLPWKTVSLFLILIYYLPLKKKKKSWVFIKTVMKYIDKNCVPAL